MGQQPAQPPSQGRGFARPLGQPQSDGKPVLLSQRDGCRDVVAFRDTKLGQVHLHHQGAQPQVGDRGNDALQLLAAPRAAKPHVCWPPMPSSFPMHRSIMPRSRTAVKHNFIATISGSGSRVKTSSPGRTKEHPTRAREYCVSDRFFVAPKLTTGILWHIHPAKGNTMTERNGPTGDSRLKAPRNDDDVVLSSAENEVIDRAAAHLNGLAARAGLSLACDVARYTLDTFYAGDYDAYTSRNTIHHRSFRELCRRGDLLLSESTMRSYLAIAHQLPVLPASVAERLSPSHHRALLPVQRPDHKIALAERAAAEGWTKEQLTREVRKLSDGYVKARGGGRPRLAETSRRVNQVVGALGDLSWVSEEDVRTMRPRERAQTLAKLEESIAQLEALRRQVVTVERGSAHGAEDDDAA